MMVRNEAPTVVCQNHERREAHIARDGDGTPIGVVLFFTPEELDILGVDLTAADFVAMQIVDGKIRISSVNK